MKNNENSKKKDDDDDDHTGHMLFTLEKTNSPLSML